MNRDEFSSPTKTKLAKRVGYRCSNPSCRMNTNGPQPDTDDGVIFYGRAAHITAASKGGPRYDETLSPEQRRDISNGIFLCDICATTIDIEKEKYPATLLKKWKAEAEEETYRRLQASRVRNANDPVIVSPLISMTSPSKAEILGHGALCLQIRMKSFQPWFSDDQSFVQRFIAVKNTQFSETALFSALIVHTHSYVGIEGVPHPLFRMAAHCNSQLFHAVIQPPAGDGPAMVVASEIGPSGSYPNAYVLDNEPLVVDYRIDSDIPGLYVVSLSIVVQTIYGNFETEIMPKTALCFFPLAPLLRGTTDTEN